jgi:flagellar motor switch protein FliN
MTDVTQLAEGALSSGDALRRLADIRVELSVEIGRTSMSLGEALALGPGSVVAVDRLSDEPVELLAARSS